MGEVEGGEAYNQAHTFLEAAQTTICTQNKKNETKLLRKIIIESKLSQGHRVHTMSVAHRKRVASPDCERNNPSKINLRAKLIRHRTFCNGFELNPSSPTSPRFPYGVLTSEVAVLGIQRPACEIWDEEPRAGDRIEMGPRKWQHRCNAEPMT